MLHVDIKYCSFRHTHTHTKTRLYSFVRTMFCSERRERGRKSGSDKTNYLANALIFSYHSTDCSLPRWLCSYFILLLHLPIAHTYLIAHCKQRGPTSPCSASQHLLSLTSRGPRAARLTEPAVWIRALLASADLLFKPHIRALIQRANLPL